MIRANLVTVLLAGCAAWGLSVSTPAIAGGSPLMIEARPFAERFLTLLDRGDVTHAYEMLNPDVRAKLAVDKLSRLGTVRGAKGGVRRVYVRTRPVPTIRMSNQSFFVSSGSVIVCFVENPMVNFKSVSYTAVTVSGSHSKMQIENFQTTSEPISHCR